MTGVVHNPVIQLKCLLDLVVLKTDIKKPGSVAGQVWRSGYQSTGKVSNEAVPVSLRKIRFNLREIHIAGLDNTG